ncbi:MAG: 3-dehydroquinate synthase [Thermoleophilia bacterium]|nr:3-dehydroquinate synthase [Thermoleophilia bacterium]
MAWELSLTATGRSSRIVGGVGRLDYLAERAQEARQRGARLYVITDANVAAAWGDRVIGTLGGACPENGLLVLPPGEPTKSVTGLEQCWEWLAAQGARRDDIVVALGGGVVGDLAGFAAATYMRGVGLWQIPTSLLAQVDSSVGGKTAVDLAAGKNLVGAFYQPDLVLIDPCVLRTLPEEEFINGLGEVVKYALLDDKGLWAELVTRLPGVNNRDPDELNPLIRRCVEYKAAVVVEDEREAGRRAVLNLGHTTAHALEVSMGYGTISHGRAVALGLIVTLTVSERLLGLAPEVRQETTALLTRLGLPVKASIPPPDVLLAAAARDKKVKAATRGFVGLRAVGHPVWGLDVPDALLHEALQTISE